MKLSARGQGTEIRLEEMVVLNERIDLADLQAYSHSVQERTSVNADKPEQVE